MGLGLGVLLEVRVSYLTNLTGYAQPTVQRMASARTGIGAVDLCKCQVR